MAPNILALLIFLAPRAYGPGPAASGLALHPRPAPDSPAGDDAPARGRTGGHLRTDPTRGCGGGIVTRPGTSGGLPM